METSIENIIKAFSYDTSGLVFVHIDSDTAVHRTIKQITEVGAWVGS